MNFKIDKDKLEIVEPRIINSGSIAYYSVDCEFDDSWNGLVKKAVLIKKGESQGTQIAVIGNQIYIDKSCYGDYYIGFVGYTLNNDNQKTLQISTELKGFYIQKGAGEIQVVETEVPPISEWEIYITQLVNISDIANTKIQEISNLEQSIEDEERDRSIAEQEREDEEQKRISAETTRAENENSRNYAEEIRASAEQTRRTNESNRIVNENGRAEAENNRSNAEETRQANESERIANESSRKLAEENREKTTEEAVNNIKDLSASYEQLAEEKESELNNIADGVKDMATAIQLPQFYVDRKMKCHGVYATKLSNVDLYIKKGKFMEGVKELE